MSLNNKNEWLKEFNEFSNTNTDQSIVPKDAFQKIRQKLFPNHWIVFIKIAIFHTIVGFSSLTICNQFGLNPFQTDQSLTNWFMNIAGHNFCMILCGLFFMTTTYLLANIFLSLEELEAVKRFEWLQTGVMVLVSLAAFYFFGAELVGTLAVLWTVGALIGSLMSIEGSYRLRRSWNT